VGPTGTDKTSPAERKRSTCTAIAIRTESDFQTFSAVLAGKAEMGEVIDGCTMQPGVLQFMHMEDVLMPTLHVRSVSEDLYNRLHALAREQNRSLSAQVITLLEQALKDVEQRQERSTSLQGIRRRRFIPPTKMADSTALLREDRSR
jgi:hypothetical protein